MKSKIYVFQFGGEKDYVSADTMCEALITYNKVNELEISDYNEDDDITILPIIEWKTHEIRDEDGKTMMSFEYYMKNEANNSELFCSTVY